MIYAFEDKIPQFLGSNHYISPEATIVGEVILEENVCILPQAVIRADNEAIYIGAGTNIQDGVIIHTDPGIPMKIGRGVTIAHRATLHGCTIGDNSVIGIGAIILNNAVIGENCVVGADALILENQKIPDRSLVVGSPGKIKKELTDDEVKDMAWFSQHYIEKIQRYNQGLKCL